MFGMGLDGMTTTHGGVVRSTTDSGDNGRGFLRVGDWFFCPLCQKRSELLEIDSGFNVDGRNVVPLKAKFSCGAELVGENESTVMAPRTKSGRVTLNDFLNITDNFGRRFLLKDELTGEPLANVCYEIIKNGESIHGKTDDQGHTELITSDSIENIEINIMYEEHNHG